MKAVVLYFTDDYIDCNRTDIRDQLEDICDDPNNFQFKEFTDETSMFEMIHNALGKPSVGVTACNIAETKNFLYAGYFIDINETTDNSLFNDSDDKETTERKLKEIHQNTKMNKFGSQLTSQFVTSNLVIVKKSLSYNVTGTNVKTTSKPDTINSMTEILNVFEDIFLKQGITIDVDQSLQSYKYIMNPLEHLILTDSNYEDNYVYHEYEIYTHVMIIIADRREINGQLNNMATLLAGKPVYGKVFIALYKKPEFNENPPYVSLSFTTLKNILNIRQKHASLTTNMNRSDREYINFEKLLELENIKHTDKPTLLATEITGEPLNIK